MLKTKDRQTDLHPDRLRSLARLLMGMAAALLTGLPLRGGAAEPAEGRIGSVRVTILSTMLADTKGIGEWGFAALVEADGHRRSFAAKEIVNWFVGNRRSCV